MDGFSSPHQRNKTSPLGHCEGRDWSSLPKNLLFDIIDKLIDIEDYIGFGRVCIPWRDVFLRNTNYLGSPLLLIAPPEETDFSNQRDRALYSLSTEKVCNLRIQLPYSKICRGYSFGWLITMEEIEVDAYRVQLHNLFLGCIIDLPPLDNIVQLQADEDGSTISFEYLWKAVLSSDPLSPPGDDVIVMGIMGRFRSLAFLKRGNRFWTPIGEHRILYKKPHETFIDVIFFRKTRQFYVLLISGAVLAVEFQGDDRDPLLRQVAPSLRRADDVQLVEDFLLGDLLQVGKYLPFTEKDENGKRQAVMRFDVFKFDPVKQNWSEIHNLGDRVLFMGATHSVLLYASDCPGCLPNHIYYTTEPRETRLSPNKYYKPLWDGIYNMGDGSFRPYQWSPIERRPNPITVWVEPTLE